MLGNSSVAERLLVTQDGCGCMDGWMDGWTDIDTDRKKVKLSL
jgi:hypothetical protein